MAYLRNSPRSVYLFRSWTSKFDGKLCCIHGSKIYIYITSHNDYSMIQLFFTKRLTNSQTNGSPAKHHTLWVLRNAEHGRGSGPSRSSFSSNGLPANMQKSNQCKLTGPESKNIRNVLVSIALPPFPGWRWPTTSSLTCTYK